jgi:hypothetical protein
MVKNCGVVKEQIRLQESLIPLPFKELTPDKLEQLGLKVRELLYSYDMKIIKSRGQGLGRSKRNTCIHHDREHFANGTGLSVYTQCCSELFTINEISTSRDEATLGAERNKF